MNVVFSIVCVFMAVVGVVFLLLWYGSAAVIDELDGRVGKLEQLWMENFGGPKPAAVSEPDDDADTETDIPVVQPDTEPSGIPIQVHSALIAEPAMVERVVNIGGTMQTFLIRAPRKDG